MLSPEEEIKKNDILSGADVKLMVDAFYGKVRGDDLLAPVFDAVIRDNWPAHLEKMYRFWGTVLLGQSTYNGSPFRPHAFLPVDEKHFDRWISIFNETVDELFAGEVAAEAKWRGRKMASLFNHKINYIKNNPGKTLL